MYRARAGVVTQKKCILCGQFKGVADFHVHQKYLTSECKDCYSTELYPKYYYENGRGRNRKRAIRNHDNITRGENGLEGTVCKSCGQWKEITQFYRTETRLDPTCRKCKSQKNERTRYVRLCRATFGEDSPELSYLENEKQYHRFKAVCKVLGLVRYLNVLTKRREKISSAIRGILPSVPMGTQAFEERIQGELPAVQAGRRRGIDVAMLPV